MEKKTRILQLIGIIKKLGIRYDEFLLIPRELNFYETRPEKWSARYEVINLYLDLRTFERFKTASKTGDCRRMADVRANLERLGGIWFTIKLALL